MKRLVLASLIVFFIGAGCHAGPLPAVIDPDVTLTSAGSLISGGEYIGPYVISVPGYGDFQAMCIDEDVKSYLDTPWAATITQFTAATDVSFLEDAWLYNQLTAPGQTDADRIGIQAAAWGSINEWSELAVENYNSVDPAGFWLISPDTPGTAQRFIIDPPAAVQATPEPGLYTLLGIGAIILGATRRRSRAGRYIENTPEHQAAALPAVATQ